MSSTSPAAIRAAMTAIASAPGFNRQGGKLYIVAMKRPTRTPASLATVSVKSQTKFARAKRGAKSIDKGSAKIDNLFASFSEWSSEADEKAYAKL